MQDRLTRWFRGDGDRPDADASSDEMFGVDMAPAPAALAEAGKDDASPGSRPFTTQASSDQLFQADDSFDLT